MKELHLISPQTSTETGLRFQASIGPLIHCVFFVLCGLALLRWLYYPAKAKAPSEEFSEAGAS